MVLIRTLSSITSINQVLFRMEDQLKKHRSFQTLKRPISSCFGGPGISERVISFHPSRYPEVKYRGESARTTTDHPSRHPEVKDRWESARVLSFHPSRYPEVKYRGDYSNSPTWRITANIQLGYIFINQI